jgi:hypothetical protein
MNSRVSAPIRLKPATPKLWTEPCALPGPHGAAARRWLQVTAERGWTPSTNYNACPRKLVHPRGCLRRRSPLYDRGRCWCDELERMRVYDRARRWVDTDGRPVVTSEPYAFGDGPGTSNNATELRAWCADRGPDPEVSDRSPHYPGRTTLLIFRRPPAAAR